MSTTFSSVIVLESSIRPGTESIEFYAQMTAADTASVTEFDVMQAVCEKVAGREVDDEFVNEAYLQDEQAVREAEAQASASTSFDAPQLFKIVMVSAGGVKHDWMCCLTQDEADRVLEDNLWQYCDENGFVWNLEVEEDTDAMLGAEGFTIEDVDDAEYDAGAYEEAEIAWYEEGVYLEAMYDPSIDKDEWIANWIEEHIF